MIYRITYILLDVSDYGHDRIMYQSKTLDAMDPPLLPPLGQVMIILQDGEFHQGRVLGYAFEQYENVVQFDIQQVVGIRIYGKLDSADWQGWPI